MNWDVHTVSLVSGEPFFDRLWAGTMNSLLLRTREDGFCQTSFGEEHDVKCYGVCHYSRDAAEAAWVLADQGCLAPATKIIEFTLRHIPEGQYFIVHAYNPDGSALHNKIQIDTPAHPARALARILEMGGDAPVLPELFARLDRVFDDTYRHHFHPEFLLLDSGNFNEQLGGSTEPLLDLFTNGAMYQGNLAMARAAELLNAADSRAARYRERADVLQQGIERFLYDADQDLYLAARQLDGAILEKPLNWIRLYPERWYPGRTSAWGRVAESLWHQGCNQWGARLIPSGETDFMQLRTMGKVIGQLLRFSARQNQLDRVGTLLCFLRETIRHPSDIYPEFWLHHLPEPGSSPYLDWFFREAFPGVWNGFVEDPDGDYTVDSGNCEQCSVFLGCFLNDVLGFSGDWRSVRLAPRLPGIDTMRLQQRSLGRKNGRQVFGDYSLEPSSLLFHSTAPVERLVVDLAAVDPAKLRFSTPPVELNTTGNGCRAEFAAIDSLSINGSVEAIAAQR